MKMVIQQPIPISVHLGAMIVVNLPEANNSDAADTTVENPTYLDDPITTVEEAPVLSNVADTKPTVVADVELLKN